MLTRVTKVFYNVVQALSVLFMCGMVATVGYVVFARYIFKSAPRWGEEIALLCMVWFALLSASLAIWDNRHIRVTIWEMVLPPKIMRILELVVHLILFGIIVLMLYYGIELYQVVARGRMAGTGISYIYLYGAVPVSAVFMLLATLERLGEIYDHRS